MLLVSKPLAYRFQQGGVAKFQTPWGPIQRQYLPVKTSYIDMEKLVNGEQKEDYSSSVKPDPDIDKMVEESWRFENPNNEGLQKDGTWKPYYDATRGQWLIGPGEDYKQNGNPEFDNGATKEEINESVRKIHQENLDKVNEYLSFYTNRPDTVSTGIKEGLMDIRYQVGSLGAFKLLGKAIAEGDQEGILRESQVKIKDKNGKKIPDTRRNNLRAPKFTYSSSQESPIEPNINDGVRIKIPMKPGLLEELKNANNNR